jgi:hypothetical protein
MAREEIRVEVAKRRSVAQLVRGNPVEEVERVETV